MRILTAEERLALSSVFPFDSTLAFESLSSDSAVFEDSDVYYVLYKKLSLLIAAKDGDFDAEKCRDNVLSLSPIQIKGFKSTLSKLYPLFPEYKREERHMMIATPASFIKKERDSRLFVLRSPVEYKKLFAMYRRVPSMAELFPEEDDEENAWRLLDMPFPFTAVALSVDGDIVSGGYLSKVTRKSAMLVSVATVPGKERNGYASSVVSEILDISFNENRMDAVTLFSVSEETDRLYSKLGFMPAPFYSILTKSC